MPNGKGILDSMEFEHLLAELGDNQTELIKFVAREQWKMSQLCPVHSKRIKTLEDRDKKTFGMTGGIGGLIGAAIMGAVDYLLRR